MKAKHVLLSPTLSSASTHRPKNLATKSLKCSKFASYTEHRRNGRQWEIVGERVEERVGDGGEERGRNGETVGDRVGESVGDGGEERGKMRGIHLPSS